MAESGHHLRADRELPERIHGLIDRGAAGEATELIRDLLFDLRRGARQIDRSAACGLVSAAIRLRLLNDAEQWARYVLGGVDDQVSLNDRLQARSDLIAVLLDQQRFVDAVLEVSAGESIEGASTPVLFRLRVNEGNALAKQGRHDEALVRYSDAASCAAHAGAEEAAILELNRGATLNSLGRNDLAIDAYRACLRFGIGRLVPAAQMNLANALRDEGRFEEADEQYRQAAVAAGDDLRARGDVLRNHARLLSAQVRRDEAIAMLRGAAELHRRAGDPVGQVADLKRLALVLADDSDYRAAARTGYQASQLSRSEGLPADEQLTKLAYSWSAMEEFARRHPDAAAALLVSDLREAAPGDWVALAVQKSPEVLRLAISLLDQEPSPSGAEARGRMIETGWIQELLGGILELGRDLGVSEYRRRMRDRLSALDLFTSFVRLDDWVDEKRLYESERAVLESPETLAMTYWLESRASDLQLDPVAVATARNLVRACGEFGIDAAFAQLPPRYPGELLHRFVDAASWSDSLRIVQAHEQYFNSGELVDKLNADARHASPMARAKLNLHIEVLQRCTEVGVQRALAEAMREHEASALGGKITIWSMDADPDQPDTEAFQRAEPRKSSEPLAYPSSERRSPANGAGYDLPSFNSLSRI